MEIEPRTETRQILIAPKPLRHSDQLKDCNNLKQNLYQAIFIQNFKYIFFFFWQQEIYFLEST